MRDDEYSAIKDRAARTLLEIPGVNAVGIGGRVVAGKPTGEPAITVFVTVKRPPGEIATAELIPSSFEGVPIDVVQGGPFRRAAAPTQDIPVLLPDINTYDPLRGGISLAIEGAPGLGTLGCFLLDKDDATAVHALTNHHVVAKAGKLSRSRRILHPANTTPSTPPADGDVDANAIGVVAAGGQEAIRDAALVRLKQGLKWMPAIKDYGFVTGTYDITHADAHTQTYPVSKRGVASGLIRGQVQCVDAIAKEIFDQGTATKSTTKGNIIIKKLDGGLPFAEDGDSGSVVMNNDGQVVGLLYAIDGNGGAYVTPIATVLRRFSEVDHLNLQVATATTAAPTEQTETREVPAPGGKPFISGADQIARGDHQYYRPLTGGAPILVSPMLGVAQAATMGCVLAPSDESGAAYLVTAYSSLSAGDTIPPTTATAIGQPDNTGHCSHCTNNTVGHFFAGPDSQKRAGFVAMSADQKWLPEVIQVGLLKGSRDLTSEDPLPTELPVVKQGGGSGLTGGVITKLATIDGHPTIVIRPNPNAAQAGPLYFSQFNDRGAAVVDGNNQVVGVLYDELQVTDAAGTHFHGLAVPIAEVLHDLGAHTGVAMAVPVAPAIDDVRTATARVADGEARLLVAPAMAAPSDALAPLQIPPAWHAHQTEIRELIARNRKVAAMWRRHGGPGLIHAISRAFRVPAETIPLAVAGVPTATSLERLSSVFCKYGSAELRATLARLRVVLPAVGGFAFAEVLASVHEALAAPEAAS